MAVLHNSKQPSTTSSVDLQEQDVSLETGQDVRVEEQIDLPKVDIEILAGNGYLHNHSVFNRIQVVNNTEQTFDIVNDYTSNGELSHLEKETGTLGPGSETTKEADVDVILPPEPETRFVLEDGYITEPGSAVRTSRRGKVTITPTEDPHIFSVKVVGGLPGIEGDVQEIEDPRVDVSSDFHKLFETGKED